MKYLKDILYESVTDTLNRLERIDEMSVSLKSYKKRVDGLRFQLVENWCICKWCQISGNKENFNHWIAELKACINALKEISIENDISKRRTLKRMLISDYDYNSNEMIGRIIRGKFRIEGIEDIEEVAHAFAEDIENLIDVICNEKALTDDYITKTFKI